MKDIVIPRLTNSQALFYFGVLATKAHLNPQFTFKYGLQGAHRVGVLLTLYGHTIAIGPRYATARGAKAAACRQALAELREYNPQWPLPAEPTEGPTDVTWNWTQLLEGEIDPFGHWACIRANCDLCYRTLCAERSAESEVYPPA